MDAKRANSGDRCGCGQFLENQDTRCPRCSQLRMDFKRGAQLRLLDAWRVPRSFPASDGRGVSGAAVKAVLRAVDNIVRREAATLKIPDLQTIDIPLSELEEATGLSNRVVRRAVWVLVNQLAVVIGDKVRVNDSPCWQLGVCWSLLCELVDGQGRAEEEPTTRPRRTRHAATVAGPHGHGGRTTRPPGADHAATVAVSSSIRASNALSRTAGRQPVDAEEGGGEALSRLQARAAKLGVQTASTLIPEVVDRCGVTHTAELLDHFEANRESCGWEPYTLLLRLRNADAALHPSEGWPARKGQQGSSRKADLDRLNAEWGFELDSMLPAERDELARQVLRGTLRQLFEMSPRDYWLEPSVREPLLRHLSEQGRR